MPIKIEIEVDLFIHKSEVKELNNKVPGIYILLDCNRNPLYVGETIHLKNRVRSHLLGSTNAKKFHKDIEYIEIIFEPDTLKRRTIEKFIIAEKQDLYNDVRFLQPSIKKEIDGFESVDVFGKCEAEGCKNTGHTNGFCHSHGGNGISMNYIKNKAIEDFISGKYKPDLEIFNKKLSVWNQLLN